jgi:hypothetical protein
LIIFKRCNQKARMIVAPALKLVIEAVRQALFNAVTFGASSTLYGEATMAEIHEGGCLCGAVRYRVTGDPTIAVVCHCTRCHRMTESAFSMPAGNEGKLVCMG